MWFLSWIVFCLSFNGWSQCTMMWCFVEFVYFNGSQYGIKCAFHLSMDLNMWCYSLEYVFYLFILSGTLLFGWMKWTELPETCIIATQSRAKPNGNVRRVLFLSSRRAKLHKIYGSYFRIKAYSFHLPQSNIDALCRAYFLDGVNRLNLASLGCTLEDLALSTRTVGNYDIGLWVKYKLEKWIRSERGMGGIVKLSTHRLIHNA